MRFPRFPNSLAKGVNLRILRINSKFSKRIYGKLLTSVYVCQIHRQMRLESAIPWSTKKYKLTKLIWAEPYYVLYIIWIYLTSSFTLEIYFQSRLLHFIYKQYCYICIRIWTNTNQICFPFSDMTSKYRPCGLCWPKLRKDNWDFEHELCLSSLADYLFSFS